MAISELLMIEIYDYTQLFGDSHVFQNFPVNLRADFCKRLSSSDLGASLQI